MIYSIYSKELTLLLTKHKKLHASFGRGYQSVKTVRVSSYKGRFGNGIVVTSNNTASTRYLIKTYYESIEL